MDAPARARLGEKVRVSSAGENAHLVASRTLGLVQGHVGSAKEVLRSPAMFRIDGDPHGDAHRPHGPSLLLYLQLGYGNAQVLGALARRLGQHLEQQQSEFLAAIGQATSLSRTWASSNLATLCSTVSPASCPNVSLKRLK